jgi:hypothetical protein
LFSLERGFSMCVHSMREEAERARRLATETTDSKLAADLQARARALDARAVQLEDAKRSLGFAFSEDAS